MTPQGRINAGTVGGVTNPDGAQSRTEVPVTFNTPRPTPAQLADALLKSLGLSDAELTAFRQDTGVDLRQFYIDDFRRAGIDYNAVHYAGRDAQTNAPRYTGNIGVPAEFRQQIARYAERDANAAPLPQQDTRAGNSSATTTAQGQELTARGAMLRRRLERRQEINDVKREVLGVTGATGLETAGVAALRGLPELPRATTPVATAALIEAAPVVAAATVTVGGAALLINGQMDASIDRYLDTLRSAPPPVPMSEAEDVMPPLTPTDTAERPAQPDVQVAPEGGALTRPVPTSAQPTNNQPIAPQGEPPRPPRMTPGDVLPPAIGVGTATIGVTVSGSRQAQASRTEPSMSPDLMRVPRGFPEKVKAQDDDVTRTGITRQLEAARVLAKAGYDIEQHPQITDADRAGNPWLRAEAEPDYKIEGRIFDCYAPRAGTSARNIASVIQDDKVDKGQARRIVLNMEDSTVSLDALREQLTKYPIPNLEEIIVIKGGEVIPFFPAR